MEHLSLPSISTAVYLGRIPVLRIRFMTAISHHYTYIHCPTWYFVCVWWVWLLVCRAYVGGFSVEAIFRWSLVEPWVENPRIIC
jgi:hypothetical protein